MVLKPLATHCLEITPSRIEIESVVGLLCCMFWRRRLKFIRDQRCNNDCQVATQCKYCYWPFLKPKHFAERHHPWRWSRWCSSRNDRMIRGPRKHSKTYILVSKLFTRYARNQKHEMLRYEPLLRKRLCVTTCPINALVPERARQNSRLRP